MAIGPATLSFVFEMRGITVGQDFVQSRMHIIRPSCGKLLVWGKGLESPRRLDRPLILVI